MDTFYWNSTLRLDPKLDNEQINYETRSSGLQALSIAGNNITSAGIITLAKHLRRNQWLLGSLLLFFIFLLSFSSN
jgi:hypothetical protein